VSAATGRLVLLLAIAAACALPIGAQAAPPITCTGIWAPTTSEAALRRQFGDRVRSERIDVGEGVMEDGSIVYPDAAESRIYVLWKDKARRERPDRIFLREKTRQVIYEKIGLGTTLKDLERLNGRPFDLLGFAWDYSGTVTSWNGGRLETVSGSACQIMVRLDPGLPPSPSEQQQAAYNAMIGDRLFHSSDRNMQYLNPKAYEILLIFR
jgi:hypothetical protein